MAVAVGGYFLIGTNKHPRRQLVDSYLRTHANDPSALQVETVLYSRRTTEDGQARQAVLAGYRDRNKVGVVEYKETVLMILNDQAVTECPFPELVREVTARRTVKPDGFSENPDGPR